MARRPRLVPTAAALAAVVLLLAGVAAWSMTAPVQIRTPPCPADSLCYGPFPPYDHQLHPLRAELLWAASAVFAVVAVAGYVRIYAQAASRVCSGARSQ